MKDFLKYTFATVTGMVLFAILIGIISVISVMGMIASQEATTVVKDNSVMVLNLSGSLEERADDNPFAQMVGSVAETNGLDEILYAIKRAKEEKEVKGIYIEAGLFDADAPASCQAIRKALADFKKSGKWIVAYGEQYTQQAYYICSVADEIAINPSGLIDWHGLAAQPMFLKDLLAKVGVKMQIVKVGKFKSATEAYSEDHMSDANREQVTAYITGVWNTMVGDVAASRKLPVAQLNAYADSLITFAKAEDYVRHHLVDKIAYTDEVKASVKQRLGIGDDDVINQMSVTDMNNLPEKINRSDNEIAIYYAYGEIVNTADGQTSAAICGDVVTKDLEELMKDDAVKAVVLRVNSPGGSAYASEQIWNAVKKMRTKKPVVVSMGGYAASGGYYISCGADYIFAEPTTLTGSIGIFGMFPDFSQLATEKLGVKFDVVKTNRFSDFGSVARPFNAEELAHLQKYIGNGYDLFLSRVAEGRKMKTADVNEIAQGRVWLGKDALKIKLIDDLGGLDKAVAKAAELAKVKDDYDTATYPAAPNFIDQMLSSLEGDNGNFLDEQLKASLGDYYTPVMMLKRVEQQYPVQARMPYHLVIR